MDLLTTQGGLITAGYGLALSGALAQFGFYHHSRLGFVVATVVGVTGLALLVASDYA